MLSWQVLSERDGKVVDALCHRKTASFVRAKGRHDPSVPLCSFYEVNGVR